MILHPIAAACVFLAYLPAIHPFTNGNGRLSRCAFVGNISRAQLSSSVAVATLICAHRGNAVEYAETLRNLIETGNYVCWIRYIVRSAERAHRALADFINLTINQFDTESAVVKLESILLS